MWSCDRYTYIIIILALHEPHIVNKVKFTQPAKLFSCIYYRLHFYKYFYIMIPIILNIYIISFSPFLEIPLGNY